MRRFSIGEFPSNKALARSSQCRLLFGPEGFQSVLYEEFGITGQRNGNLRMKPGPQPAHGSMLLPANAPTLPAL